MPTTRHIGADEKAALIMHLETAQRFYTSEAAPLSKRTKAYKELTARAVQAAEFADLLEAAGDNLTVSFSE
jgi:hypothetical protein